MAKAKLKAEPKAKPSRTSRQGAKHHPSKVIAQAMALLIAGSSVEEVSQRLKIPKQTVSDWRKELPEVGQGRTKKETIEELLTEYLEQAIRANLAQVKVFSDAEWIKKQNAADLATLHGVLFDKLSRVFDAAKRGAEQQERQQPGRLNPAPED